MSRPVITVLDLLVSPRSIQAFMVVIFTTVVSYMAIQGEAIPDLIGFSLAAIVGFYFGESRKPDLELPPASPPPPRVSPPPSPEPQAHARPQAPPPSPMTPQEHEVRMMRHEKFAPRTGTLSSALLLIGSLLVLVAGRMG